MTARRIAVISAGLSNPSSTRLLADRLATATVRALGETAEGIETNELAQTLAALGCTYGQGFLYSRALARDEAYSLLIERNALPESSSAI